MPITVELQGMLSYSLPVIAIFTIVVIVIVILSVILLRRVPKQPVKQPVAPPPVPQTRPLDKNQIKQKYHAILMELENKCRAGNISDRRAYQELSKIVRLFVHEVTGVKVHNYTLEDIERMNTPDLYGMIEECYVPEFAIDDSGDIYDSINRARKVIGEWN